MDFPCGGCGACGKCRVKIISKAEPPKEEEIKHIPESELKEGIRLACLFKVNSDVELEVAFKEEEAKVLEQGIMTSFDRKRACRGLRPKSPEGIWPGCAVPHFPRKMVACSCAAGPALEGVNISCGMRAASGAIDEVKIEDDVFVRTIGDERPKGICGSGIVDLVAELLKVGFVEQSGRMLPPAKAQKIIREDLARRLVEKGTSIAFVVAYGGEHGDDVYITARDIRQVQLAKGAIWAGIRALLKEKRLSSNDIDRVYVAGAFGAHLRPQSLSRIGMIAAEWEERLVFAGNTSKTGALMCLLSRSVREEAERIAQKVRCLELSTLEGFDRLFADSLRFPEGDRP